MGLRKGAAWFDAGMQHGAIQGRSVWLCRDRGIARGCARAQHGATGLRIVPPCTTPRCAPAPPHTAPPAQPHVAPLHNPALCPCPCIANPCEPPSPSSLASASSWCGASGVGVAKSLC